IGIGWCFFINGLSYIAMLIALFFMSVEYREEQQRSSSAVSRIAEGLSFVLRNPPVYSLSMLLWVMTLSWMLYATVLPIFADRVLYGGVSTLAWLSSASGIGALAAGVALAGRKALSGLGDWVAASTLVFGVGLIFFSLSRVFWASATLLALAGFAMVVHM